MKKLTPILIAIVAIAAGAFFAVQQSDRQAPEISGFAFPSPKPLAEIELIDQDNALVDADFFKDKWTFIYVGYTFCPDACPMTMTIMDQLHATLADNDELADNVQMMLVSIDPERDTPDRLKSYVSHFNDTFVGVTGTADNLSGFASQVSAVYVVPDDRSDPNYLVDHSSTIILIDPNAAVHALFTPPQAAQALAADFKILRKHFS
ncbi:MAG: SCO family protein [Pseudomonadota bacterium]